MSYILCAGEALYDFISKDKGKSLGESVLFEKRPGGAPLNVAVGLARLGNTVEYLTKLSDDPFGRGLKEFLESEGVGTSHVVVESKGRTTLAFVSLGEDGKPDFAFYREGASDTKLTMDEVRVNPSEVVLYHFGSISLLDPPSSETFLKLFEMFSGRVPTSFDPNVRPSLIKNKEDYIRSLEAVLEKADVLKLSEEDMVYIFGDVDLIRFVRRYGRENKATFLTLGERGSVVFCCGKVFEHSAVVVGNVVDTTGCGDAYMAGVIHVLASKGLDKASVSEALELASVVAGIVATRFGAANSMPTLEEVTRWREIG